MLLDEGLRILRTCTVGLRATTLPCIAKETLTYKLTFRASTSVLLIKLAVILKVRRELYWWR